MSENEEEEQEQEGNEEAHEEPERFEERLLRTILNVGSKPKIEVPTYSGSPNG